MRDTRAATARRLLLRQCSGCFRSEVVADKKRPVMEELAPLSARKVAAELNRRGLKSATGGQWYPATVLRLRERLA
jgi:hypothetical protein